MKGNMTHAQASAKSTPLSKCKFARRPENIRKNVFANCGKTMRNSAWVATNLCNGYLHKQVTCFETSSIVLEHLNLPCLSRMDMMKLLTLKKKNSCDISKKLTVR